MSGTESEGFAPGPEPDLCLPPAAPDRAMVTVRRDDLRAVLAVAFDLASHSPEFHRLAQAAGIAR